MPKIIQFTHPGSEHSHDKNNPFHKSWNIGKHKRKFMHSKGQYIINDKLNFGELLFWGEWEPPSTVTKLREQKTLFHPKWLHRPYLPDLIPNPSYENKSYQNTDPFVFDKEFKYFICKQFKSKTGKTTKFSSLEKGSIILFGSTGNQNKNSAFFQLDTVFVIADYIEYDSSDPKALSSSELDFYNKVVFKMAFPYPTEKSMKLRLYVGATYENPVNGMYSFSPSQIYTNANTTFPRLALKDLIYLTNNLNAAPKTNVVSIDDALQFWNKIRTISRENGLVEGVSFVHWKANELDL
jgi:hypothetical protein